MLNFDKYEDFKNDPFLGQSIDQDGSSMFLMGSNGIEKLEQLNYMAGGMSTSYLCGFKIKSSISEAIEENGSEFIYIVFVVKNHTSYRVHKAKKDNPSQWFTFFPLSTGFRVLSAIDCLKMYAIDLNKFFSSKFFKDKSKFLQEKASELLNIKNDKDDNNNTITKNGKIIEFIEKLKDPAEKSEAIGYMKAIKAAIENITKPSFMNRSYDLHDFDNNKEKYDMPEIPNEAELDKAIEEALRDIY